VAESAPVGPTLELFHLEWRDIDCRRLAAAAATVANDDRVRIVFIIYQLSLTPGSCSPALTTMDGSASNGISQHYSPPPNYSTSQFSLQQPQHPQSQSYQSNQPSLSINPQYIQYYPTQHQQQQQQSHMQGTLSPQALHSPSSSIMSSLTTPTFYHPVQASSSSQATTPQARKENFQAAIKPLLLPNSFSGAGAVNTLVTLIADFGSQDVSAQQRLEILTKIRDNAGNHYFRAWSENMTAIDITREWLKAGATAKSDSTLVETIMPLLHVSNTSHSSQSF
jgi:protein phosphatase 1 regulatory subunit 10